MNILVPYIWLAGGVHLLIASANFFLPRKLELRFHLSKIPTLIRQIFIVHTVFIVLTLFAFSALCFFFAPELAGNSSLGRFLSGFLALFWLLRAGIQLFYYDPEIKRQNPFFNALFVLAFLYLGSLFAVAAAGVLR